jgi:hypothetical protein
MNVTVRDLKQVGGFGLAGAIVASAYSLFQVYAKQKTGQQLEIETFAVQDDDYLFSLLQQFQSTFSDNDKVGFLRVVDASDQLVFLRMQLQNQKILPGLQDRVDAYVFMKRAEQNLERITKSMVYSNVSAREIIHAQQLSSKIFSQLETHVMAIMRFCADV